MTEPRPDLASKEGAERYLAHWQTVCRRQFEQKGEVMPTFHLFATRSWAGMRVRSGEVAILLIQPDMGGPDYKDRLEYMLRRTVSACRAIGVLTAHECWMIDEELDDQVLERLRNLDTLEHEPKRKEAIFISLEHLRASYVGRAFIERPAEGPARLGPFERMPVTTWEGRFMNLLHRERFA